MRRIILRGVAASLISFTVIGMNTPMAMGTNIDIKNENFISYPTNIGQDTELIINTNSTDFSLWSPMAEAVKVNIYDNARGGEPAIQINLNKEISNGTWHGSISQSLIGKYYTFQIKYKGEWLSETPGVWARAVGVNGERAAIIDLNDTNPKGWKDDKGPRIKNITDAVIYEMHHRDFSIHKNSGIVNKGKFIALLENGTLSLNGEKTGIDHLKELGITHVHILPSYDYNSIDETQLPSNSYNWGYDPVNYNAPEGSYSTNPNDPATRIIEMKEMVKALHDAGIGVIMDVVYNHTALGNNSNFSLSVPGYYYRQNKRGGYSDASGCGNETASDRPQVKDYIVNSVRYWAKEYHIDGFRFDLMAIHDINTMNKVAAELKKINPDIFVYGEGWTAGDSPLPLDQRALKMNVAKMKDIAVFSDDIRDAIKGHYSDATDKGFATGKPGLEETVKIGIVASTAHPQVDYSKGTNAKEPYATSPLQIINYVSCHDDLTLTDKLAKSMPNSTLQQRIKAAKLAQTIVFTSQGTPFIFAGEEIFRDKKGVHNSYKSPDSINAIDWNQKKEYRELFDYYVNLIALRKAHAAFRMTTAEDIAKNLVFDKVKTSLLISYSLLNHANDDSAKEIKVILNGADKAQEAIIPKGKWNVLIKDGKVDVNGREILKGGKIEIAPQSALILSR